MYKKIVLDYFNARVAGLEQFCSLALERKEPEGIHQLRVENKRLKAFFCLLESINPALEAKKYFSGFRQLSKSGAAERDAFVQLELLNELTADNRELELPGYREFIRQLEETGWNVFQQTAAAIKFQDFYKKAEAIDRALRNVTQKRAESRAMRRFEAMCNLLAGLKSSRSAADQVFHQIRIVSKEAYFTYQIIQNCFSSYIEEEGKEPALFLKQTHQLLGRWHDCEICRSCLKEYWASPPKISDQPGLEAMRGIILERKERLKEEFIKLDPEFKAPFRSVHRMS
ncbi:MAG: hypothetical protein A3F83_16495 [Candidatus Glassbacteria bacterium RIFCSPLOWO2_12_FULL_58_11]|uniref:CHAD domain-containing protein n=1 Tax=Candidatus Glassbacteria bacterium RIFCSPLOWO2_12_FULL_58_11 TaxID=1817867 RepID=A0A1F5Z3R8_9BACT|nr:MAG: hypothetical protein A3F83_16495 [Candidatus Glassbacteria bacterium RIFCSPLOWO2_12_FULL_58_11]